MSSVMVVGGLAIAACGGGDDGDDAGPTTPAPGTAAPETTAPPTTAPATTAPPTTAPATTAPATTEPAAPPTTAAAAWAPLGRGEFEVGVTTITVDDPAGVRPLTVDVWFPLDAGVDPAALSPQQYTLLPGVFYQSPEALAATAEQAAAGPFPLVVYSHGSGGLRYLHSGYTEVLASHGLVVAAPDHTGNTALERLTDTEAPRAEILYNRPNDVRSVIDAMTDPAHPTAGPYAAAVDAERIAVTGHSFGGFTSVATVTGFANEIGEVAPDDRVDAVIPLAPALPEQLLSDEQLAELDVPMMVLVGTDDIATPVEPNVTRLWDLAPGTPAYRIELVAAEHQTFTDFCVYQDAVLTLEAVPEIVVDAINENALQGCAEGDMDDARANDITSTYVIQFLDQVWNGGPGIDTTPPGDVIFQSR